MTVRWTPGEKLEFGLTMDFVDMKYGNGNTRFTQGPYKTPAHQINHDSDGNKDDQEGNGQALKIKYRGEDFNLLSITSRRYHEVDWRRDIDCTPFDSGLYNLYYDSNWLSQEIRVTSPDDDRPLQWLGGIFLYSEYNFTDFDLPAMIQARKADMETLGYAAFGQATLAMFERLHLTAGLRYSYDDLEGEMDFYHFGGNSTFDKSASEGVLLPKVSIAYDLTQDTMAYTTVARGYNTGGFNTGFAEGPHNFTFGPEFTWNYEAGMKSVFLNNRISFNLALFYIDIDDKQVAERDKSTAVSYIRNAAEAHSMGFEMELQAKLVRGLDLFAGFGYTDIEFDEWSTGGIDYAGKKMPNAPKFTCNLGLQYRHPSGFFGRSDLIVTDEFYSDAANTQKLDGKTLVNLRAGYEEDSWDVMFWCKNLFNDEYQTMGFASMFDQVVDGPPRAFGATLSYYF